MNEVENNPFLICHHDPIHFYKKFERNRDKYSTCLKAYEATEQEHEQLTGFRRYSDWESFRIVRRRIERRIYNVF